MKDHLHISFDLETLATTPDAHILSIGACSFDLTTGEIVHKFHKILSPQNQKRFIDPETVMWWMGQSKAARESILQDTGNLLDTTLVYLSNWVRETHAKYVWGNGAIFDISILENAIRQVGGRVPWLFYNVRDMRTIVDLAQASKDFEKSKIPFEGTKHSALSDAIHQAKIIMQACNILGV